MSSPCLAPIPSTRPCLHVNCFLTLLGLWQSRMRSPHVWMPSVSIQALPSHQPWGLPCVDIFLIHLGFEHPTPGHPTHGCLSYSVSPNGLKEVDEGEECCSILHCSKALTTFVLVCYFIPLVLPLTKYHRLDGLNNRNIFPHIAGGWEVQE